MRMCVICIHGCKCVHICGNTCVCVCACSWSGYIQVCIRTVFLNSSPLYLLKWVSWTWSSLISGSFSQRCPLSASQSNTRFLILEAASMLICLEFTWVLGIWIPVLNLGDKCFIHWAVSPVPMAILRTGKYQMEVQRLETQRNTDKGLQPCRYSSSFKFKSELRPSNQETALR